MLRFNHASRNIYQRAMTKSRWSSALVSPEEAMQLRSSARFIDATWFMPNHPKGMKGKTAFEQKHIWNAVHFDIDKVAVPSKFPHMLPQHKEDFWTLARQHVTGTIHDSDEFVVYDHQGLFSAARVWYSLLANGAQNVRVLDGGLAAWQAAGGPVASGSEDHSIEQSTKPKATEGLSGRVGGIWTSRDVASWAAKQEPTARPLVLDARSAGRFRGDDPEPRPGILSGHVPGSISVPFDSVLRPATDDSGSRLLPSSQLRDVLTAAGGPGTDMAGLLQAGARCMQGKGQEEAIAKTGGSGPDVVTTCGSGVTASVLALALHECGVKNVAVYDGSWSEWGTLFAEGAHEEMEGDTVRWRQHGDVDPYRVGIQRTKWEP